jgi:hypothetical protein
MSPLTVSGVARVRYEDSGAAAGLINVAHQLGGSLGLGILVVVFASAGVDALGTREVLAHRVSVSLAAGCILLALALILTLLLLIVRPRRGESKTMVSQESVS